jgi:hypothetical protein
MYSHGAVSLINCGAFVPFATDEADRGAAGCGDGEVVGAGAGVDSAETGPQIP